MCNKKVIYNCSDFYRMKHVLNNFPKKYKYRIKLEHLIFLLVSIIVLYRGLIYEPDSYAFLSMEINRSPGYLIFISFFKDIFGEYLEYPLLIIQLSLNLYGISIFHKCLNKIFKFRRPISLMSLFILMAPVLYLHLTANKIMSEALSYPLYLIFITNSLYVLLGCKKKNLVYLVIILVLLIFVRSQFLSLIPVGVLLMGYMVYTEGRKKYLITGVCIIMIPFVVNIMDRSFHYIEFGHFISTPFTGPGLIGAPFYLSDKEDIMLFDSKEEKEYFKRVKDKLDQRNWTSTYINSHNSIELFPYFKENYSNICNQTIHEIGMQYYKEKGLTLNMQYIATNDLTMRMLFPLLLDNLEEWIKLYIQNIKSSLGNTKQLLLHIIFFGIGVFLVIKKNLKIGKVITFLTVCVFSNIILLAIVTHSIKRYTFYNDWVMFIIFFLFIDSYLKTLPKNVD